MIHTQQKMHVAVLRGGPSDEYEVSMKTGAGVLAALAESPFYVEDIVITKNGEWLKHGIVKDPKDALAVTDVVFIALHGTYGEDGTVQRMLDRMAIPYTGSRAYPSAIAMNKLLTKNHLKDTGIKMPKHLRVTSDSKYDVPKIVHSITNLFGPEYVVKPMTGGSSIGTHMAHSPSTLVQAIERVLEQYDDVIVEERIRGREATCGVVERFRNQPVYRLPSIEIVPPQAADYFDYTVKYNGQTQEICPSRFTFEQKEELERLAHIVHETIGLSQYSRSDFIVTDSDIYFLEVNTLPGLTAESLVPKSLEAVGCSYKDFILHLLTDAVSQHRR